MPKESAIQAACLKYLKEQGAAAYNNPGGPLMGRGRADIFACYKGHFLALEVKQPGEKCTKLQVRELDRVDDAGGVAAVVHSKEELVSLLKDLPGITWIKRRRATKPEIKAIKSIKGVKPQLKKQNRSTAIVERSGRQKKQNPQEVLF